MFSGTTNESVLQISEVDGKEKPEMNMFLFSERRKLGMLFEKWADENNVAKKPESVIAYLQIIGALDAEKAREALKIEETRHP